MVSNEYSETTWTDWQTIKSVIEKSGLCLQLANRTQDEPAGVFFFFLEYLETVFWKP